MTVDFASLKASVIAEMDKLLFQKDSDLFHEFLAHGEEGLAIEFACAKLLEHKFVLSKPFAQMLEALCEKMELSPQRTWEPLWVEYPNLDEIARAHLQPEESNLYSLFAKIYLKIKSRIEQDEANQIEEFFSQAELGLAIEDICYCLTHYKIPISQHEVDDIRSVWPELGHDLSELKGFIVETSEQIEAHDMVEEDAQLAAFFSGLPGKGFFPRHWCDKKTLHYISDIATDPNSPWIPAKNGGLRVFAQGVRDNVKIKVVMNDKEGILTAYPIP